MVCPCLVGRLFCHAVRLQIVCAHKRTLCGLKEWHRGHSHRLFKFHLSKTFFLFFYCVCLSHKYLRSNFCFTKSSSLVHIGTLWTGGCSTKARRCFGEETASKRITKTLGVHIIFVTLLCFLIFVLAFNLYDKKSFVIRLTSYLLSNRKTLTLDFSPAGGKE